MGYKKSSKKGISQAWLLAGLLVTFFAVAVGYGVTIPPGEGVDEAAHFDYVRYVKEQGALPIQPMSSTGGVEIWMGHHPPLYYVLAGLAISWIDTSDFAEAFRSNRHFEWRENDGRNGWNVMLHFGQDRFPWGGSILALQVLRLLGIVLATITLYAIYRAAELLFPDQRWIPLGVTAVVAFNPSFTYMSSTVHHDVLQAMVFALAMWWIIRYLTKPARSYEAVLAGVLIGAAILTKLSGLVLAAVIGLVLFLELLKVKDWSYFFRQAVIAYGIAALVAGWWFIRNQWLYGDPLGWQMFLNIHNHMIRPGPYTWPIFTGEFLAQIGRTFWGGFGFMHITFPEITKFLWWSLGLAVVGFLVAIIRKQLSLRERWAEWTAILAVLFLIFISFVRFSMATVGAGHGRYLFPAAFTVGVVMIVGLNGFTRWRHQRLISTAVAGGMLAYAIWLPYTHVLPKYKPPSQAAEEALALATPLYLQFAKGLSLVGYHLEDGRVEPGQSLLVTLYWQADGNPATRQDPKMRLSIADDQGDSLVAFTGWPVPSLSPNVWSPEEVFLTQATLTLPPGELPALLHLTVEPVFGSTANRDGELPESSPSILTEIATIGRVSLVDQVDVPNRRREILAGQIGLQGFAISPDPATPGDILLVELYWHVLDQPPADYTTFVHLINDLGEIVTQFDRLAGGTAVPTSAWIQEQTMHDMYPLKIPEGTPPGVYTIRVGMYTWPSLERLPITDSGQPAGDSIDLRTIQITPS